VLLAGSSQLLELVGGLRTATHRVAA